MRFHFNSLALAVSLLFFGEESGASGVEALEQAILRCEPLEKIEQIEVQQVSYQAGAVKILDGITLFSAYRCS